MSFLLNVDMLNVDMLSVVMLSVVAPIVDNWSTYQVLHSRVGSWPYPQSLDYAGESWQGQTLELITKISNYWSHNIQHSEIQPEDYEHNNVLIRWRITYIDTYTYTDTDTDTDTDTERDTYIMTYIYRDIERNRDCVLVFSRQNK
jgi:hypothetical protein